MTYLGAAGRLVIDVSNDQAPRPHGVPAYFLGRPSEVYLRRFQRRARRPASR